LRRADAAKVCGNVGLAVVDGAFRRRCNAGSEGKIASAPRAAAPVPRGDVCFRRHQHMAYLQMARKQSIYQGVFLTKKHIS
jgi:hypothetical protein